MEVDRTIINYFRGILKGLRELQVLVIHHIVITFVAFEASRITEHPSG